jgi:hypothetical protein
VGARLGYGPAMRRRPISARHFVAALVALSFVGGCKWLEKLGPKEGDRCAGSGAVCRGNAAALVCHGGKYVETACAGPQGCSVKGDLLKCDFSGDEDGARCAAEWDDQAVCGGTKRFVRCKDGKISAMSCRGPNGCKSDGENVRCDMTIAVEGDPCSEDAAVACTADQKSMLSCVKGKMTGAQPCRGPAGCHPGKEKDEIVCDNSLGVAGDPCTSGGVCSVDGTSLLDCKEGKLALAHVCRKGRCEDLGDTVRCSMDGLAEVGDPCDGLVGACSVDEKAVLVCHEGKFVVKRACACLHEGDEIRCR